MQGVGAPRSFQDLNIHSFCSLMSLKYTAMQNNICLVFVNVRKEQRDADSSYGQSCMRITDAWVDAY